jgi:hypothetical protein
MKVLLSSTALILVLGFGQCNSPVSPRNPRLGRYTLAGYDLSGRFIFTGVVSFVSLEQNQLKGQCSLAREKDAPEALFDQKGRCEGSLDGEKVTIDFSPATSDGGLLLKGQFDGGQITGVWMFDSFAGSKPQGTFIALKNFAQPDFIN